MQIRWTKNATPLTVLNCERREECNGSTMIPPLLKIIIQNDVPSTQAAVTVPDRLFYMRFSDSSLILNQSLCMQLGLHISDRYFGEKKNNND